MVIDVFEDWGFGDRLADIQILAHRRLPNVERPTNASIVTRVSGHPVGNFLRNHLAMRTSIVDPVPSPLCARIEVRRHDILAFLALFNAVVLTLVHHPGRRVEREKMVEPLHRHHISVEHHDLFVGHAQIAIGPKPESVLPRKPERPVPALVTAFMWHINRIDFDHMVKEDRERLARVGGDLGGDQTDQIRLGPLATQPIGHQERAGDIAVVHHHESHISETGRAVFPFHVIRHIDRDHRCLLFVFIVFPSNKASCLFPTHIRFFAQFCPRQSAALDQTNSAHIKSAAQSRQSRITLSGRSSLRTTKPGTFARPVGLRESQ